MERRGFLKMMIGGVAAAAAVRTFPFRVFSFPKEIFRWPDISEQMVLLEPDASPLYVLGNLDVSWNMLVAPEILRIIRVSNGQATIERGRHFQL